MRKVSSLALAAIALSAAQASAAMIPNAVPVTIGLGSAQGDSPDPGGGSHVHVVNGDGLTIGDVNTPSTWVHDNNWMDGWQHKNATSGSFILDFGSTISNLDKVYIWNVTETGSTVRGAKDIEIYYATNPTVTPVNNVVNDFTSGGWTSIGTQTLTQATASNADPFNGTANLGGVSARYVGIRMANNYGGGDVGLAEVEVTKAVPEPATLSIIGVGLGSLMLRRHRRA